jgi:hypothetical protein
MIQELPVVVAMVPPLGRSGSSPTDWCPPKTSDLGPLWPRCQRARTEEEVNMMRDEEHPHQCPYCDLRFLYANEIRDHVLHDHTEHAEAFLFVETHELP